MSDLIKKEKARSQVYIALNNGTLQKQPCEVCGEQKAEAHHPNHDQPLKVNWLCKKHHSELHNRNSRTNELHKKIIQEWNKTRITHPSYAAIAEIVGCAKSTVHYAIHKYQHELEIK